MPEKRVQTGREDRERGRMFVTSGLISVAQAAEFLGVGRRKIFELIEWGEIKAVKLGRNVQIEKDSIEEFKASGRLT